VWLDPGWERRIEEIWKDIGPAMQHRVQAVMDATGKTRIEVIRDCFDRFQTWLEQADDQAKDKVAQDLERSLCPFGKDPLLNKSES
jgi:hypothetical protein